MREDEHSYRIEYKDKYENAVPLSEIDEGDVVVVRYIMGGGRKAEQRLKDMGLYHDSEVEIIQNTRYCPLLIHVVGTELFIGRGLAGKVYVEKARTNANSSATSTVAVM